MRPAFALPALLVLLASPLAAQDAPADPAAAPADPAAALLDVLRAREDLLAGRVDEALAVLRPAAEAGDPRAQTLYGTVWEFGDAGAVDIPEAMRWYEAAYAQGYATAAFQMAELHRYGAEGFAPDLPLAREWYARAAEMDHLLAFGNLAEMLIAGEGGPMDEEAALVVARRAADLGEPLAATTLGRALLNGWGTEPDHAEARRYLLIGAAGGNAVARNDWAYMSINGLGGSIDVILADEMLRLAMGQGLDIAGQTRADLLVAYPAFAEGPLDAAAHCFWANEFASWQWSLPEEPWREECRALTGALPVADQKEARRLAAALTPAE